MTQRDRPPFRVELALAYCAWAQLAPASLARFTEPELERWFDIYLEAVRSDVAAKPDDWPGQRVRRAIIRGKTPDEPFPGEIRARALIVDEMVRSRTVEQLLALGSAGDVCRALGCTPRTQAVPSWKRALETATGSAA